MKRFKFFDDDSEIINFLVEVGGIEEVLEEYQASVVDFPLPKHFQRRGNYWVGGDLYYSFEDGTTILIHGGHMPTGDYDHHCFSDKEFSTLSELVRLFGLNSLNKKVRERYEWYTEFLMLNETRRGARKMTLRYREKN
jgi:hypothetical protein